MVSTLKRLLNYYNVLNYLEHCITVCEIAILCPPLMKLICSYSKVRTVYTVHCTVCVSLRLKSSLSNIKFKNYIIVYNIYNMGIASSRQVFAN